MLQPKRVKYRKQHRGRRKGKATSGASLEFGSFGIISLEPSWITARQIESARVVLSKKVRKNGKVWIRIFPDKPITKKPAETRMGKGKGAPEYWVAVVKPGSVLFEIEWGSEDEAKKLLKEASIKLPVKTKFIKRGEIGVRYEGF